jgi:2-oxoglutarate ferredoxin oxidoreductase subunit delta
VGLFLNIRSDEMTTSKKLVLNSAWCKGCGICVAFCPKEALELKDEKVQRKEGTECVLCGMCELRCPDYAIYIEERDDEEARNQWVMSY